MIMKKKVDNFYKTLFEKMQDYGDALEPALTHYKRLDITSAELLGVIKEFRSLLGNPIVLKGGKEEAFHAMNVIMRYESALLQQAEAVVYLIDDMEEISTRWVGFFEFIKENIELFPE